MTQAWRGRVPMLPAPPLPRGRVHIRVARCKGCELCIECCPVAVLARSEDYNAAGYHYPVTVSDGCICCQGCASICPEFAIFATPVPEGASRGTAT